ncbi:hypothetical protein GCM10019016_094820 [Streptomyces prasinosporus]|uniref:N-acetyltransferase domain-containing protein n=1 Tax=Streptomyces prasinosporus TaxID=68256 RepID=A0ABP6U6M5_9ACTN
MGPTGEIEIGWRLAREHWGKGYVTAAALETLEPGARGGPDERRGGGEGPHNAARSR